MESEIKDILIAMQGSIIKIQEDVSGLKQDVTELKQDVKELKRRQDKYEASLREVVYDILIPIRDNKNYINQEIKAELERIKSRIA